MFGLSLLPLMVGLSLEPTQSAVPQDHDASAARAYRHLVLTVDSFDVNASVAAREQLVTAHVDAIERLGNPPRFPSLVPIGERFSMRTFEWWTDGPPSRTDRVLIVWWNPNTAAGRRTVLAAEAIGEQYRVPVVAVIDGATPSQRALAADIMDHCPNVYFAAAPEGNLSALGFEKSPALTYIEEGVIVWQGVWEQLRFTPMHP